MNQPQQPGWQGQGEVGANPPQQPEWQGQGEPWDGALGQAGGYAGPGPAGGGSGGPATGWPGAPTPGASGPHAPAGGQAAGWPGAPTPAPSGPASPGWRYPAQSPGFGAPTSGPPPQPWISSPGAAPTGPTSGPLPRTWAHPGQSAAPTSGPLPQPGPAQQYPAQGGPPKEWQPSYSGFGAFGEQKPRRSKKPFLAGAGVIVLLAGGAVGAWLLGAFQGDTLDHSAVQDGVVKILREDFGEGDVQNAKCPEDQPVRTGTTFECTVSVAGQPRKVTVRVLNDQAQYEVGMPR